VSRVSNRLVIQVLHASGQGLAKGPQPARGVEGFVGYAVEGKLFIFLQRLYLAQGAVDDRLARIAVFVDQAVGAPGQVVFQRIARIDRQRATRIFTSSGNRTPRCAVGGDRDETGGEAALRHECGGGALGEALHCARTLDVFGQVE
jgi:hypothetical protein